MTFSNVFLSKQAKVYPFLCWWGSMHIDTIRMELPILYLRGYRLEFSDHDVFRSKTASKLTV